MGMHATAQTWAVDALAGALAVPVSVGAPVNSDGAAIGAVVGLADMTDSSARQSGVCYQATLAVPVTITAAGDTLPYLQQLDAVSDDAAGALYAAGALTITSASLRTTTDAGPRWARTLTAELTMTDTGD